MKSRVKVFFSPFHMHKILTIFRIWIKSYGLESMEEGKRAYMNIWPHKLISTLRKMFKAQSIWYGSVQTITKYSFIAKVHHSFSLIKTAISTVFQLYKTWQSQITELDLSPLPEATGKQEKKKIATRTSTWPAYTGQLCLNSKPYQNGSAQKTSKMEGKVISPVEINI